MRLIRVYTGLDVANVDDLHLRRFARRFRGGLHDRVAVLREVGPPAAKTQGESGARAYYERLDGELAQRPCVAGERFTVADITALVTVDFATNLVELKPDDGLSNLWRWHAEMSARPSATA